MTALPVSTPPAGAVATRTTPSVATVLARAVVLGVVTGALLRYAMRLVSTQPSFSWDMTALIVALCVLLWVCVGLAEHLVGTRGQRRWGLLAVPGLALFNGAGMLLLPGVLLVTLAGLVRSSVVRVAIALAGGGGTALVLSLADDGTILGPRTTWVGATLMCLLVIAFGAGLARVVAATRSV